MSRKRTAAKKAAKPVEPDIETTTTIIVEPEPQIAEAVVAEDKQQDEQKKQRRRTAEMNKKKEFICASVKKLDPAGVIDICDLIHKLGRHDDLIENSDGLRTDLDKLKCDTDEADYFIDALYHFLQCKLSVKK